MPRQIHPFVVSPSINLSPSCSTTIERLPCEHRYSYTKVSLPANSFLNQQFLSTEGLFLASHHPLEPDGKSKTATEPDCSPPEAKNPFSVPLLAPIVHHD